MKINFKGRVDAFWQWFLQNECKLSELITDRVENHSEEIMELMEPGLALIGNDVHFDVGGDHEFSFAAEGALELFFIYKHLVSRMPAQLAEKWHFFPFKQGDRTSFNFRMYDKDVSMADVQVSPVLNPETEWVDVLYYHPELINLPIEQADNAAYIMTGLVVGEGIMYCHIGEMKRAEEEIADSIPLTDLRERIVDMCKDEDGKLKTDPAENFSVYQLEPNEDDDRLRRDVVGGVSSITQVISEFYAEDFGVTAEFETYGVLPAFIWWEHADDVQDLQDALNCRYQFEEALIPILSVDGVAGSLGGATGLRRNYLDVLIFDLEAFEQRMQSWATENPTQRFFYSPFTNSDPANSRPLSIVTHDEG